eukprot:COSAG02_NODE_37_length_48203_cov_57.745708_23_plen_61_part_00
MAKYVRGNQEITEITPLLEDTVGGLPLSRPKAKHDHNDVEATGDGHRQDLKMGMAHANSK